ncbi:MAG: tyrosine-type recombinase/integrase [Oscillospiraceae bacterium]|nr:tyrosine-type recombinase/integrase [Oscillospiraceae bacterium]
MIQGTRILLFFRGRKHDTYQRLQVQSISEYSALGKMINNYCKELGIRQRSLHKTRKTVASMMHADGIDDLIIQKELGHKDVQTTQKCYCYDLTKDEERYEIIAQSLA